jgi:hypothetical protein
MLASEWAGGLQDCASTTQTHNPVAVGCHSAEWLNNSGKPVVRMDRNIEVRKSVEERQSSMGSHSSPTAGDGDPFGP